jgi:hypothetical protein
VQATSRTQLGDLAQQIREFPGQVKRMSMSEMAEAKAIPTLGELFPDGSVIDQLRGNQLAFWQQGQEHIARSHQHNGRTYIASTLDPQLEQLLRLPLRSEDFGTGSTLIADLSKLFSTYLALDDATTLLIATFILSTWVVDCLPAAPCLNPCGDPEAEPTLLELMACLCRRPLRVTEPSLAQLAKLPAGLCPTLIVKNPNPRSMAQLLTALSDRDANFLRSGRVVNLQCASVAYTLEPLALPALPILLRAGNAPYRRIHRLEAQQLAEEFQPRLLRYRLVQHQLVTQSQFDCRSFSPLTRYLARILGAAVEGMPVVQQAIVDALVHLDQQCKSERSQGADAIVLEALLALCHEGQPEAFVAEISELANGIFLGRRERLKLSPKAVGGILRGRLGLYTERRAAGYRLMLTENVRRRIHQMAASYHVLSLLKSAEGCPFCIDVDATVPKTVRYPLQTDDVQQVHQVHESEG